MNILILGHKGMLGHMLVKYFNDQGHETHTISHRFPSLDFKSSIINFKGDFIINAIGAIPQKTKDFSINSTLPIWLDLNSKTYVIHPGTDCEMDNDEYGLSKKQARDYIITKGYRTKIIRSSIIGPELENKKSLLEWFLNNDQMSCDGYTKAMWNGITTYEWAKQCYNLINNWEIYPTENIISGDCVSKYQLLKMISKIFNKEINIIPIDKGINKCLIPNIETISIEKQLIELKEYYYGD